MEMNATRRKLMDLIIAHHSSYPGKALTVNKLSEMAGISRQAFNRYYADLKDYAAGKKALADLMGDTSSSQTKELINQYHSSLVELQQKLDQSDSDHEKEMKKTLDSYISSLMMNDLTIHGANDLRVTAEKRALHNAELIKQINQLEIELTRAKQAVGTGAANGTRPEQYIGEKIKVDVDLSKAIKAYEASKNEDDFEDKKDLAISAALNSVKKLASDKNCHIVLFAERYLTRFSIFFENFTCPDELPHIIVRLPIFDRTEVTAFIDKLPPTRSLSIYIPYLKSKSETKARRSFFFNNVPEMETRNADDADPLTMNLDVTRIVHYRATQGD